MKAFFSSIEQHYAVIARQPLLHLVIIIWIFGLIRTGTLIVDSPNNLHPIVGLSLNTALGFALLIHLKRYPWLFIPILSMLVIILALTNAMGFQALWQLTGIAVCFGASLPALSGYIKHLWHIDLPTTYCASMGLMIITSTTIILLIFGLFSQLAPWLLLPTLLIAMAYIFWHSQGYHRSLLHPILLTFIGLLLVTQLYFIVTGQNHAQLAYENLLVDLNYSIMIVCLALFVLMVSNIKQVARFYSNTGFLLSALIYCQAWLVSGETFKSFVIWVLATLVSLFYWGLHKKSATRAAIATLSLAFVLFQCLYGFMPKWSAGLQVTLVAGSLLILQIGLSLSSVHNVTKVFQTWLLVWAQCAVIFVHITLLLDLFHLVQQTQLVVVLVALNWFLYRQLKSSLWYYFSLISSFYLWHVWHVLLPWTLTELQSLEFILLQSAAVLGCYAIWAKWHKIWRPGKFLPLIFYTVLVEWIIWIWISILPISQTLSLPISLLMAVGLSYYLWVAVDLLQENGPITRLLITLTIAYLSIRFSIIGWQPIFVVDVLISITTAYGLYGFYRLHPFKALSTGSILLALFAFLCAPVALHAGFASFTWIVLSGLCIWAYSDNGKKILFALGVLLLMGSVYIWMPIWMGDKIILQLYILPTTIALLIILHLHRHELKPTLQHQLRLMLLVVLYVGAGIDLFISDDFGLFVLAMSFGMLGILLGISLRIRAFLYAGTAFVVLNILGQLIQFYPDQRLGKALVLMGGGAFITVAMILFNLKRQAISTRITGLKFVLKDWA